MIKGKKIYNERVTKYDQDVKEINERYLIFNT